MPADTPWTHPWGLASVASSRGGSGVGCAPQRGAHHSPAWPGAQALRPAHPTRALIRRRVDGGEADIHQSGQRPDTAVPPRSGRRREICFRTVSGRDAAVEPPWVRPIKGKHCFPRPNGLGMASPGPASVAWNAQRSRYSRRVRKQTSRRRPDRSPQTCYGFNVRFRRPAAVRFLPLPSHRRRGAWRPGWSIPVRPAGWCPPSRATSGPGGPVGGAPPPPGPPSTRLPAG